MRTHRYSGTDDVDDKTHKDTTSCSYSIILLTSAKWSIKDSPASAEASLCAHRKNDNVNKAGKILKNAGKFVKMMMPEYFCRKNG